MFPSIDLSLINTTENDEMQLSNNHVGRSFYLSEQGQINLRFIIRILGSGWTGCWGTGCRGLMYWLK